MKGEIVFTVCIFLFGLRKKKNKVAESHTPRFSSVWQKIEMILHKKLTLHRTVWSL